MKIEVIHHYGVPFVNNAIAGLIASGITHHIVLILYRQPRPGRTDLASQDAAQTTTSRHGRNQNVNLYVL